MRESVKAAWPAVCRRYEGVTTWMYLDTKGLVTTGIGFLIDSVKDAQALAWHTTDGSVATPRQVAAEWNRVKARQAWDVYAGTNAVWKNSAALTLQPETVDRLLTEMTPRYWQGVVKSAPNVEDAPADAQLALLDLSWQNGAAFLDGWTNTRTAVRVGDWTKVATLLAAFLPAKADRTPRRLRFFRNAAAVVQLGLDPERLWDATTPAPSTPPVVVTPAPPVVVVMPPAPAVRYAPRHGDTLAKFALSKVGTSYGIGWCQKFTNECGQTGSVGDYDGDKAADAEDGWKKAVAKGKVVKASDIDDYDAIPAGVYHYWTGGGSDHGHAAVGVGGRKIVSTDMTDAGPRYGKVGLCDISAPSRYWSVKYAGYALVEGNGYTLADAPAKPAEPTAYPAPTSKVVYVSKLEAGQKNSDSVWWVQKALGVPLTGTYDAATVEAVKVFQQSLGDVADGDLGPLQTAALFKALPTLGVTVKEKP